MKTLLLILLILFPSLAFANVPNATPLKNVYSCNSATTQFSYGFPISTTSDMTVWLTDTSGNTTQVNSNFSVDTTNLWVNYPLVGSPCATGYTLTLLPQTPQTQTTTYTTRAPFTATAVGASFDKLTMIDQQLQEQLNRAVLAPIDQVYATGAFTLPPPLSGAVIGWNSSGYLMNYTFQGLLPTSTPTFAGLTLTGLSGILKSSGASGVSSATADVDYTTPAGAETFTNKTYDTTGTGNTFKVAGTTLGATGVTGSGSVVLATGIKGNSGYLASTTGSPATNNCAKWDANGNLVDNGSTCAGGSGMTYPGTSGIVTTNTSTWTTSIPSTTLTVSGINVGISSTAPGNTLDVQGTIRGTNFVDTGAATITGNVGIGTIAPVEVLEVYGKVKSKISDSSTAYSAQISGIVPENSSTTDGSGSNITFKGFDSNGSESVTARIGTQVTSHTAGAINTDLVLGGMSSGTLYERMRITSGGNVGISSTNPSHTLDVSGTINASGAITSSGAITGQITSGAAILYGNGYGGFSNATIGTGLGFSGGTLKQTNGLGSWVSESEGQIYQASTDGIVIGWNTGTNDADAWIVTDSNATPTTVRVKTRHTLTGTAFAGVTCPVRKGDYWEFVTDQGAGGATVYWISIGS